MSAQLNEITFEEAMDLAMGGFFNDTEKKNWERGHGREKVFFTDHYVDGKITFRVTADVNGHSRHYRVTND